MLAAALFSRVLLTRTHIRFLRARESTNSKSAQAERRISRLPHVVAELDQHGAPHAPRLSMNWSNPESATPNGSCAVAQQQSKPNPATDSHWKMRLRSGAPSSDWITRLQCVTWRHF